jgi:hypothetical protein
MSQPELLIHVVRALEAAGIEYMATGSIVSSLQGEPRATHDIDLVVSLPAAAIRPLLAAFPGPDFHLDAESLREAVQRGDMFSLLDLAGGDKVDFWLLTEEPFDRSRFARRRPQRFQGVTLQVSSPEDTILQKLRWAQLSGGSEKQSGDALRVYEVQFELLDQGYLDDWAARLGVDELLARLRLEAEPA